VAWVWRELQVGVGGEEALRIGVDHAVERIDGLFDLVQPLVTAGDVHERERGVVAVGGVGASYSK
jgi:hypothetical protein